jgi:hypothetical protein
MTGVSDEFKHAFHMRFVHSSFLHASPSFCLPTSKIEFSYFETMKIEDEGLWEK